MRLKVPFIEQIKDYICGPTALHMVLCYHKNNIPIDRLSQLSKTTEKTGTTRSGLVRAAKTLGYEVHAHSESTLKEIKHWIDKGLPVIVNFRPQRKFGHYAVVIGYTDSSLIFHDPWYGRGVKFKNKKFLYEWYGYHEFAHRRWLMVLV